MSKTKRKIISIDEEKCNGCGLCATACHEGAIRIIDGKARLVSETYCDGLGDCIGECPQDAITMVERDAEEFDAAAVARHMEAEKRPEPLPCGCPGTAVRSLEGAAKGDIPATGGCCSEARPSSLRNWPVQLALVPVQAPYLEGADLLIAADCTPFAFAGFHEKFLAGKVALIGCPKLDDAAFYRDKLTSIFENNDTRSVEVVFMEVPCCSALVRVVRDALAASGKDIPLSLTRIGISGDILESVKA